MPSTPVVVLNSTLTDIANAIRGKNGSSDTYKPSEMPAAITAIPSGGGVGIPREISPSGIFQMPSTTFTYTLPTNATDVGRDALYEAFREDTAIIGLDCGSLTTISGANAMNQICYLCTNLASVDLDSVVTVSGENALQSAFYNTNLSSFSMDSLTTISGSYGFSNICDTCTSLSSVNLRNLKTVGFRSLQNAFNSCLSLKTLDLSSITTATGDYAFYSMCNGCTNLESVDLSGVVTTGFNGFQQAFAGCTKLTSVSFDSVSNVGNNAFVMTFNGCTSLRTLSFPSLTPNSFGSYTNQFNNMLISCSGVTVHFPAAIQSTIGSWVSVTNGFGGTNTIVLFDL